MTVKSDELVNAEFFDEWEKGFGWVARPGEGMRRTSHVFVDDGVYLVDPLDAENLDQKIKQYGEVEGIVLLFERHERDSVKLAERYDCPIYVPKWFERPLDTDLRKISGNVPGTEWEIHDAIDSISSREACLYHKVSQTLVVADALGTIKAFRGRGEELGINPFYRLNPPRKLLGFRAERVFCGHGEGIQSNASEVIEKTIENSRKKVPSAIFNSLRSFI